MSSPETPEAPRRLSLSRVLELVLTKSSGPGSSSVTIGRTPRGDVVYEVVGRLADEQSLAELELEVSAVFDSLETRYPRSDVAETKASVDLTRNAKGETQIAVEATGAELGSVLVDARKAYDSARSAYPLASGLVGAEPVGKGATS